jgi:preprotein translocase subunit SecG
MQFIQEILLVIHLIVAVGIIALVLLQPAETGGFAGNSGSMSNLMAPRRTADAMTRATTILAGCFFCTSLLLAVTASSAPQKQGILEMVEGAPAAVEKTVEDVKADAANDSTAEADKNGDTPAPKAPLAE